MGRCLTGDLVSDPQAGYWPAQTRQTVRFADAVATLAREGVSVFLEVGPDGSLSSLGPDAVAGVDGAEAAFVALQRRDDEGTAGLLSGLARAFVNGAPVNWASVLSAGEQVELPRTPSGTSATGPRGFSRSCIGGRDCGRGWHADGGRVLGGCRGR